MISSESSREPASFQFDIAVAALGYEKRCRYVCEAFGITSDIKFAFEFGFLKEKSYIRNHAYFVKSGWKILSATNPDSFDCITEALTSQDGSNDVIRLFVDVSSMSREMMANVALAINESGCTRAIEVTVAYAPACFAGSYPAAPIRSAAPVKATLAGWSSRPEKPLGVVMGLGCEPGLALGALQVLEPAKAWLHAPKGVDKRFDLALAKANKHVADIFDVTEFDYDLNEPAITRGRIEALINSVENSFRLVCVPFGPKIYAWLLLATVVFGERRNTGIWSFSSKEGATAIDRAASGKIAWYSSVLHS